MSQETPAQALAQDAPAIEAPAQVQRTDTSPVEVQDKAAAALPSEVRGEASAFLVSDDPFNSFTAQPLQREVDELGLPIVTHGSHGWTLPEAINTERWDLLDDDQSDEELETAFGPTQPKGIQSLNASSQREGIDSRASPFAPFLPGTPHDSKESKETDIAEKADSDDGALEKVIDDIGDIIASRISPFADFLSGAASHRPIKSHGDTTGASGHQGDNQAFDSEDVMDVLKGVAAAAAGGLLTKVLLDDSGDESGPTSRVDSPVPSSKQESGWNNPLDRTLQLPRQAPQRRSGYSYASTDIPSSSDDGLTFDEGAGVGKGFTPRPKTPLRHEYILSEDSDSEPSLPRFTAAQKGKQVDRAQFSSPTHEGHQDDDLPPITSITDTGFNELGNASLGSLLSPIPASSPPTQEEEKRTQIYPSAPPGPWTSEPLANRPSLRRAVTSTTHPEAASTLSKDEQNFAFMSSARKQTSPPKPASDGVKSLLTDFPDVSPKPSAPSQPVVTLPEDPSKAPVLRGQYELPAIKKIDQWKGKNSLAPNAFRRLLINIGALILSSIVMRGRFYRSIVKPLFSILSPSIAQWAGKPSR
ncbi:hypothetical protein B0O80DRAFT_115603 [Mortierella sp. GBAus27b]|nr:hypothetical protein B0O80DRAFT_115603 [Mortierella sp. GBAus27b]